MPRGLLWKQVLGRLTGSPIGLPAMTRKRMPMLLLVEASMRVPLRSRTTACSDLTSRPFRVPLP